MDLLHLLGEVMSKTLQLKRGPSTDDDRARSEDRLQRYDGLLPAERAARPAIDAARGLFQPSGGDILRLQGSRITLPGQPGAVD